MSSSILDIKKFYKKLVLNKNIILTPRLQIMVIEKLLFVE
jgi:hypothetical protein